MTDKRPYRDPSHELNGDKYLTGKTCIEKDCSRLAGTAWSPYWCQSCNAARLDRINAGLSLMLTAQQPRGSAGNDAGDG